jgi:hypothetical protein
MLRPREVVVAAGLDLDALFGEAVSRAFRSHAWSPGRSSANRRGAA